MNYVYRAYKIIDSVLRSEAFSTIELNKALKVAPENEKPSITKIVYGTLENSVKYDYYIKYLCVKNPKGSIKSLLKVGMFLLFEMDSVPQYAAIDECVKIAKKISRGSLSGFVNAMLRAATQKEIPLPEKKEEMLSVKYSVSQYIVEKLLDEYGEDMTKKILEKQVDERECVRSNARFLSGETFAELLTGKCVPFTRLNNNAFAVALPDIDGKIDKKLYTCQALASIAAVDCLEIKKTDRVLDVCAAPGGKAIYAAEKAKEVVACDAKAHRVELIKAYANRMGAENVVAMQKDGTEFDETFFEAFDKIVCDVPCSGSGVMKTRPDVLFGITEEGLKSLNALQYEILANSAKYLKKGGLLLYSTCSLFSAENDEIVAKFLERSGGFEALKPSLPLFCIEKKFGKELVPNLSGTIGFYISILRKL